MITLNVGKYLDLRKEKNPKKNKWEIKQEWRKKM